jgi:hypothetical protein
LAAHKKLHEKKDSAKLITSKRRNSGFVVLYFIYSHVTKRRGYAMPIELLVPIAIFGLGIVVSVTLGGIGIDRVIEANKK